MQLGIGNTIMVKWLEKRLGQRVPISDNRTYETGLIDACAGDVRILGRVVWRQRRS
jgi:phage repressor protein C with HTH and peptisase S24 domain